jgi:GT2 family glycosyltransferase
MTTPGRCPIVYIIILNWNKLKETLECVESALKTEYPNFEIVLIDNHSQEFAGEIICARFPQVKVIENKSNLGYTGGNNQGIKYALERGADYIWLLNNDTIVEKETLGNLVKSAQGDEKIGLVSPLIYYFEAPDKIEGRGRLIDWKKRRIICLTTGPRTGSFENISGPDVMVTGTALLIKKKVVDTIGYLDESFFAYYEDDDYSIRALKAGFINFVSGSSKVFHKAPLSSNSRAPYYYYYLTRNRFYFRSKHFNYFSIRFAVFIDHFIHSFLLSGICAPGKNFMAVDASLEGAWAGFQRMTGPWEKNVTMPLWLKWVSYPMIKTISALLLFRRGVRKILFQLE